MALLDILDCSMDDLIEPVTQAGPTGARKKKPPRVAGLANCPGMRVSGGSELAEVERRARAAHPGRR
jgi:hypothetical protein